MRLLHTLRKEHDVVEIKELTVVRDVAIRGPELLAHLDAFVDPPPARTEVELGGNPFFFEPARADAELHPPAGDEIERLHQARGREGMPEADVVHVRAEADASRLAGEKGQVDEGIEDRRVGWDRWMLLPRMW